MKKIIQTLLTVVLASTFILAGAYAYRNLTKEAPADPGSNTPAENADAGKLIGGDREEHGCLIAAGYSWCESKGKCLRTWEEECGQSSEEAIKAALAEKHGKEASDVAVSLAGESENHARGQVNFLPESPGNAGWFLAVKVGGRWEIVFDGNGAPACAELEPYEFPNDMKSNCY